MAKGKTLISSIIQYPLINLCSFILLSARVPKDRIYPVLVTQARYVAPDISGVSKSRVKDNSMASRMNPGNSNDLNCIRIDPRTGEKFSFNVDIVAATAWQHPQQCTFIHTFHPMEAFLFLYCTLRHCRPMKSVVT